MAIKIQTISDVPIDKHVQEIMSHNYGLPEFQRTFVWNDEKVKSLWESLYEGYPVGQFLFWTPEEIDFPMRSIGKKQIDITNAKLCVVDGQQRLTAIYLVLTGEIELLFNLETKSFHLSSNSPDKTIKLDILKNRTFDEARRRQNFVYNATDKQKEEYADELYNLNSIYTQTIMPYQVISHSNYRIVVSVFDKLNQQGVRLSDGQIALARISTIWKGVFRKTYDLLKTINDELNYQPTIDSNSNGEVTSANPDLIIKAWTAVHTGQHQIKYLAPENEHSKYFSKEKDYEESWLKLGRGFKDMKELVSTKFDLSNYQFIKAYYPLVVLINYFANHSNCSEIQQGNLARWFIHSIIQGRYSDKSETKLREDIKATNNNKDLNELFTHSYSLNPDKIKIEEKDILNAGFYSSYSTLLYILYRALRTQDFLEDIIIGEKLPENRSWQYHHIFPKANFDPEFKNIDHKIEDIEESETNEYELEVKKLVAQKEQLNKAIYSIANLTFLTPKTNRSISDSKNNSPLYYLEEISKKEGGIELLNKHFIPIDRNLWKFNNFEEFRKERTRLIINGIENILKQRNLI